MAVEAASSIIPKFFNHQFNSSDLEPDRDSGNSPSKFPSIRSEYVSTMRRQNPDRYWSPYQNYNFSLEKRRHRHRAGEVRNGGFVFNIGLFFNTKWFFKECPHPDNKQRIGLSQDIGIDPCQVKFWFQNKRTQMKKQHEHQENTYLRLKNKKLRAESVRFREALSNGTCPACGQAIGDVPMEEHHLRMENAGLIYEINHISRVAANYSQNGTRGNMRFN